MAITDARGGNPSCMQSCRYEGLQLQHAFKHTDIKMLTKTSVVTLIKTMRLALFMSSPLAGFAERCRGSEDPRRTVCLAADVEVGLDVHALLG